MTNKELLDFSEKCMQSGSGRYSHNPVERSIAASLLVIARNSEKAKVQGDQE